MDPAVYAYYERLSRNPDDAEALFFLWEHHGGRGEFQQLAQLVEQTAARRAIPSSAADLYFRAGELWAKNVGRADKAVACYKRSFELDATQLQAAEAARQIYLQLGNVRPAAQLLAEQLGRTGDPLLRSLLLREGVQILGQVPDWDMQIAYINEILASTPDDWEMLRELAGAYLARSQSPTAQPDDAANAAQVLSALAQNVGGEHGLAFAEAALDAFPGDEAAYAIVHEAYYRAERTQDLALRQIAFLGANPTSAYAPTIRRGLAEMYASVEQYDDAIACLEPIAADDLEVTRELAGYYRAAGRVDELAQLLAQFAPTADPVERMRDLKDLAELYGNQGNRAGMLTAMREVLTLDPADPEALALVEDDLRARGEYGELRDILAEAVRCEHCPPEMRVTRLREIASLSIERFDDPESAMHAYREILDVTPDDPEALQGLDGIHTRAGEWTELAQVLERQVAITPEGARTALLLRLADVARDQLDDADGELAAVTRAWNESPDEDELSDRLVGILRARGDLRGAAQTLRIRAERAPAHLAIERWRALAKAWSDAGEHAPSVDALREALRLDPESEECFDALDAALDAAGDLQARYDLLRQRATALPRGPARAALHARASAAARALGDSATALDEAEVAVAMDPSNESLALTIIDALDSLGQHQRLVAFIHDRLQQVFAFEQRQNILRRAGRVLASSDPAASGQYWEELRALRQQHGLPDDPEAVEAIATFAEQAGDYPRVIRLLGDAAEASSDPETRRVLLTRRARTMIDGTGQTQAGLDALLYVAREVSPDHAGTWLALEGVAITLARRDIVAEALRRQASLCDEDDDLRGEIAARAVALSEASGDDPNLAFELLLLAHEADPSDLGLTQRVADAAEAMERWRDAVPLLLELIEVEGDDEEIARLSMRVAAIQDGHLEQPREAWAILVPLATNGDLGCVEMLQDLSSRRGFDADLVPLLAELADRVQDDEARGALFVEVAERTGSTLGDTERALDYALKAVESHPASAQAVAALERYTRTSSEAARALPAWQLAVERAADATSAHDAAMMAIAALEAAGAVTAALDLALGAVARAPADDELLDAAIRLAPGQDRDQELFIALDRRKKSAETDDERLAVTLRAMQVASAVLGDFETARQYLDQGVALSFSRKGFDDARLGDVERAARAADEAAPECGLVTSLIERLAERAEDCVDEDPRAAAVLLRRAGTLCAEDLELDEHAWTLFGRAVNAWPADTASADALEACAERLGRFDEVVSRYADVIDGAYDANVARTYTQRRALLLAERLGRFDEAIAGLQRVVEIAPKDLDAIHRWQGLLERVERWQELLIAIDREMEAGGDRTECLRRMARVWEQRLQNQHEARQLWRRVLRGAADDPEALEALQRLERRSAVVDELGEASPQLVPPIAAPAQPDAAVEHIDEPAVEHIDEPAVEHIDEPAVEHIDEPAIEHIDEPAADPRSAFFEPLEVVAPQGDRGEAEPAADPRSAFFEPAEDDLQAGGDEVSGELLELSDDLEAIEDDDAIEAIEDDDAIEDLDELNLQDDAPGLSDAHDDGSLDALASMVAPRALGEPPQSPSRAPPPLPPFRRRNE